jgi:hypothetical protein
VDTDVLGKDLAKRLGFHQIVLNDAAKKEALSRFLAGEISKHSGKAGFLLDGAFNIAHITEFEKEVGAIFFVWNTLAEHSSISSLFRLCVSGGEVSDCGVISAQ